MSENGDRPDLPEGWEWTTVGETTLECRRGRAPSYSGGATVVINQKCVRQGTHVELAHVKRTNEEAKPLPDWATLRDGDVLVNSTGTGTLGRVGWLRSVPERMTLDTHVTLVRPDGERVSPEYLGWWLHGQESALVGLATGSTNQKELGREAIKTLKLPLPPLDEQRRIAALIEQWMTALADGEESLTAGLTRLDQFDQSLMAAAFSGSLGGSNGEASAIHDQRRQPTAMTLGQLCERVGGRIQTGPFGSQLHASDYREDGIPLVMPKDLDYGTIATDGVARIGSRDAERLGRHAVEPGDILQSRRGDLRRRALVTEKERGWICGTGCFVIRLNETELARYVMEHLAEPTTARFIDQQAAGVTMPNLNRRILGGVPLRVPSRETRRAILDLLRSELDRANDLKVPVAAARQDLDRLRRAVLFRAFTGSLEIPARKLI